jgi:iron(III) transport system substrate-binding protein
MQVKVRWLAFGLLVALAALACGGPRPEATEGARELIVYSGRNEALVGPLLERLSAATGIELKVRYASTSELVATLLEEGDATPADVFVSQDAAALGALSAAGMLRPLGDEILERVEPRFRSPRGDWVGISGRVRCLVYAPERISVDELPRSLAAVAEPRYRGRFGLAPTNGSFQAHMAVFGVSEGREALVGLLAGLAANQPARYAKNSAIVEGVIAGEIDFGLVNHYYLWRARQEDPAVTALNFFQPEGKASSFINLAGAAVLNDSSAAAELVAFLLSDEAQAYFASETFEYPLAGSVAAAPELVDLDTISTPAVDYGMVSDALPDTLAAIAESGLVQ